MIELVSWNVNRKHLWRDSSNSLACTDIGLFQEAPRPAQSDAIKFVPDLDGPWTTTHWKHELRTCIAQLTDSVRLVPRSLRFAHDESDYRALGVSRGGTLTVADVMRDKQFLFTVVSVYAPWESPPDGSSSIYADASAHRLLSDLSGLVTGRRSEKVLIAGDWNVLRGYGEHGSQYWKRRYGTVFERAQAMGLRLVGPERPQGIQADPWPAELPSDSSNVPTFHHSRQSPKTATRQLDFVFATENLAPHVQVTALNHPEEWGPSDHCRVKITVDV